MNTNLVPTRRPCPTCNRVVRGAMSAEGRFYPGRNWDHAATCLAYDASGSGVADWMKSPAWLANIGHVLAGYAVILTAWAFTRATLYVVDTWGALVAYAILKEYVFDLRYESGETVLSSTVDFVGYIGGAGLGTLVVELARAFAH